MNFRKFLARIATAVTALFLLAAADADAATIQVNSTADTVSDDGTCTLREAITSSNADVTSGASVGECAAGSGADTISFDLSGAGPHTIAVASQLPSVTETATIDGSTEPDEVILDGDGSGANYGIDLVADNSTVKDLSIVRFFYGVWTEGDSSLVTGSRLGTNESNTAGIGNTGAGVYVTDDNVTITESVISGNAQQGIRAGNAPIDGLTVTRNRVGTNSSGTAALPNNTGITVLNGSNVTIGGSLANANLFSGNTSTAITVTAAGLDFGDNTTISYNLVGTNLAGTAALANGYGVAVTADTRSTTIDSNLISGNLYGGILLDDSVSTPNTPSATVIQGNGIGVNLAGTGFIPNGQGIRIQSLDNPVGAGTLIGGATGLTPGGACTGDCNVIAGNNGDGITVHDDSEHVAILGNEIRNNTLMGIDLSEPAAPPTYEIFGVTSNDLGDADVGGNGLQNYPEVDAAANFGGNLLVTGAFDSLADENYRIELFGIPTPDGNGHGEGETFLGAFNLATPASDSTVSFARVLSTPAAAGTTLTSTATLLDPVNDRPATSEFGENLTEGCTQTGSTGPETLTADDTGEVLCALDGDDTLQSGSAGDILWGGPGTDTADFGNLNTPVDADLATARADHGRIDILVGIENLLGTVGADTLAGDSGANQINPGAGADTVYGNGGDDVITVNDGEADTLVDCGPGNDTVTADPTATEPASLFIDCETINRPLEPPPTCETDPSLCPPPTCETDASLCPPPTCETDASLCPKPVVYKCDGIKATIVGTNQSETINGTSKRDVIVARAGKDKVYGKGGNDLICAGDGVDTVFAGDGADRVLGQDGADVLKGGNGVDKLLGNAKNDKLYGQDGADTLKGGNGKDTLVGNAKNDKLFGEANADTLKGGNGIDKVYGGDGADVLYGQGNGKDLLYGQAGFDKLNGGTGGHDFCDGGTGRDRRKAPGCERRKRLP